MIYLPVLTELKVENYGLFPGEPRGSGITWSFRPGLSLIAGINGLGKTTLLMMILRSFTGPYDLTGSGVPQSLGVVLPESPVSLNPQSIRFFAQRVADGAENAEATLSATIGERGFRISRRLKDLSLESFDLDEKPVPLPAATAKREELLQSKLAEFMGLGNFVDVLLVLHHVMLFHENRPGALWDSNAQRQLLRALCLDGEDALRVVDLERNLQSADSQARNIQARITATERDLRKARQRETGSEGVLAQLEAEQILLDADLEDAERLETAFEQLDADRHDARLTHERTKIEREDAVGEVERLKYTALFQLFPNMHDTTRLVISRIMSESRCLVCNADAKEKRIELERQTARGCCPVCGAEPTEQDSVIAPYKFEQAKLDRARERADRARREEETKSRQLRDFAAEYDQMLQRLSTIRQSIQERKHREQRLRSELPKTTTSKEYENVLKTLHDQLREWKALRATRLQELRALLDDKKETITAKSNELMDTFAKLTRELLVEEVRLAQVRTEPHYMQAPGPAEDRLRVPAYAAEMTAADRTGFVRRNDATEVSESQRELVDLAFRLALVKVFGGGNSSTFVMETPEASLDGLAMERVGGALAAFAEANGNRLVVTSNLTNAGIITALFGGPAPKQQVGNRMQRVLNLLRVAAPNRALRQEEERYRALLEDTLSGADQ